MNTQQPVSPVQDATVPRATAGPGLSRPLRGLARSDASAEKIRANGGEPVRGDMQDHDLVVSEATAADATAHLASTLDYIGARPGGWTTATSRDSPDEPGPAPLRPMG
jgi:hypothetical protein